MAVDEYNNEKKGLPIAGILLMILGLIGYITYILLQWQSILPSGSGLNWAVLIGVIVIFAIGAVCIESAKKKKYGSRGLIRAGEVLSWCLLIAVILGIILRIFVH
ncbi:MAG TPA: hypothetical protein O0X27_06200 [Methanocorpusculum sp.]|nr:hypothetical protein [Methanocorpusculum sp.]